uniref:Uncharacterized protein n=1 Tax=Crocodylus porosus TaxID=8502 RepID=A0A7M4EDU4_CROPO
MVNKDMNGFPVKKCSAFQFFKKRVRRWIKSPMVSVEKHPNTSLKYPGSTVMHIPQGESELASSLCQTCLSDHSFQQGIVPQDAESSSWESHRNCKVSLSASENHCFCCFSLSSAYLSASDLVGVAASLPAAKAAWEGLWHVSVLLLH